MCAVVVRVRELALAECEALLGLLHVGAMAFAFRDRIAIALVNYVYRDGWIYVRMEDGPEVDKLRHHHWAAFEAREASGIYDWRTVTVSGSVELLSTVDSDATARDFEHAVAVLRSVVPAVFTARDPIPQRVHVFRLHADSIAGREARAHSHNAFADELSTHSAAESEEIVR
jgi:nitroimidazol reductase NimA-like FMN-containing flavoprotein (pyridoxamine 5'-phosphate oxidase superfamily)